MKNLPITPPNLNPTTSNNLSPKSTFSSTTHSTTSPSSIKSYSTRSPLPIAGKFLRAVEESNNNFYDSTRSNSTNNASRNMPEILDNEGIDGNNTTTSRSNSILSNHQFQNNNDSKLSRYTSNTTSYRTATSPPSSPPPPPNSTFGNGRISSLSSNTITFRHPLRPVDNSTSKLHKPKSHAPSEFFNPPVLPEGLKKVLISIEEMLEGHEALSGRLLVYSFLRAYLY